MSLLNNNNKNDVRLLMKQKLAEKQQQQQQQQQTRGDGISGKEKLKLMKQLKEFEEKKTTNHSSTLHATKPITNNANAAPSIQPSHNQQKKVSFQMEENTKPETAKPFQLPAGFFDNSPPAAIIAPTTTTTTTTRPLATTTTTSIPTPALQGFPVGFFDNPHEEKEVRRIIGIDANTAPPSTESSTQERREGKELLGQQRTPEDDADPDLNQFLGEIQTISQQSSDPSTEEDDLRLFELTQQNQKETEEEKEEEEPEEEEEEEDLGINLLSKGEYVEKLRQTTYETKLGLLYQKLAASKAAAEFSSSSQKQSTNDTSPLIDHQNNPAINITEIEKEIRELESLLVDEEAFTPSLQSHVVEGSNTSSQLIDSLYDEKLQKKRKRNQLIRENQVKEDEEKEETQRRKRLKETQNTEDQEKDEEDNDSEEEEEDDDEEDDEDDDGSSFVYNPLEFINYPH